jgi:DNA mismatch endonuclease (patch repair protein)
VFPRKKVCIFVDGCFWHGCPIHARTPNANGSYWKPKIARNAQRDQDNDAMLTAAGWVSRRYWEHEILSELDRVVDEVAKMVSLI